MNSIALASVITSGLVAIASALMLPIMEWARWRRERAEANAERIRDTTRALLREFTGPIAGTSSSETAFLDAYYSWDLAVLPYCTGDDLATVKRLRTSVESIGQHLGADRARTQVADVIDVAEVAVIKATSWGPMSWWRTFAWRRSRASASD
jgi:hypothetical protein